MNPFPFILWWYTSVLYIETYEGYHKFMLLTKWWELGGDISLCSNTILQCVGREYNHTNMGIATG